MTQVKCNTLHCLIDTGQRAESPLKGVGALLLCILIIIFLLFYVGPQVEKLPMFQPVAQFIDESGIEANMYFYTEVEEFSEANINMDNSMAYPPRALEK
jgi:hypothetical protein